MSFKFYLPYNFSKLQLPQVQPWPVYCQSPSAHPLPKCEADSSPPWPSLANSTDSIIIYFQSMWREHIEYSPQDTDTGDIEMEEDQPLLFENDFLKMINLEERYNYFKSLIKLQRLHNYNESGNEKNMVKVMIQLIEYYAQCISEAEVNIENIIVYFQQKMRDLNYHYKAIIEKQAEAARAGEDRQARSSHSELGAIPLLTIQDELKGQEDQRSSHMKSDHTASLMVAIQNQNIEEHISNSLKKVDFLKKSIACSIKNQEEQLESRLRDKRKKFNEERFKFDTPESITTTTTSQLRFETTFKRKKEVFSSFHEVYRSNLSSSGSDLDEAESLYLTNFNMTEAGEMEMQDRSNA